MPDGVKYTRATSPYWKKKRKEKLEAQDRYVQHVALGFSHADAAKAAKRAPDRVKAWMYEDPKFVERVDRAKVAAEDPAFDDPNSFEWRRKRYLHNDTPAHQREMIDAIEATGDRETTVFICAPESAKTTMLADLTTDTIALDPDFRTCFRTAGRPLATKIANQIKNRLTDEQMFGDFIKQYGPFKPESRDENKPWAVTHFTVRGATHDEKECTVEAQGVGSSIYGGRYNRIVFDDPQERKPGGLRPSTDDILTSFHHMSGSRLVRGGSLFLLGSRLDEGDVYAKILEDGDFNHLVMIPALKWKKTLEPCYLPAEEMYTGGRGTDKPIELVPGIEEEVASYWPEWHSLRDLAIVRDVVKEEAWYRSYMQKPQEVAAKSFTEAALEKFKDRDNKRSFAPNAMSILGVDPALSQWAGFVGATCDHEHLQVSYVEKVKSLANIDGLASHINYVCGVMAQRGHRPNLILIESDYYAKLHDNREIAAVATRWGARLEPHETKSFRRDKTIGIAEVPSSMLAGEMSVLYHDDATKGEAWPLLQQMEKWRPDILPKHLEQDLVVAAWIVWRRWIEQIRDQFQPTIPRKPRPAWMQQEGRHIQALRSGLG